LQVDNRKRLFDVKMEESFKLDSVDLQKMGYKAGVAFDRAQDDIESFYFKKGEYGWYKKQGKSQEKAGREARNRYYAYRDKRFKGVAGGEAVSGGLSQTMLMDKYFSDPLAHGSFGYGPKAERDQKLWKTYRAESLKMKPDMKKILAIRDEFSKKLQGRYEQRQRVMDWVAAISVATTIRYEMKSAWSDYYQGPGNSVYTNMGKAKVKQLEKLLTSFFTDDRGETREGSIFAEDIKTYFGEGKDSDKAAAHKLAYRLLEWYYH